MKNIIRQNKKGALLKFLFGSNHSIGEDKRSGVEGSDPDLDQQLTSLKETMKLLQNQVDSLQEKVIDLENQLTNTEYPLRSQKKAPDATKTIKQGDSTLKVQKNDSRLGTHIEIGEQPQKPKGVQSNTLLAAQRAPLKASSTSKQYDVPSAWQTPKFEEISADQNQSYFKTLAKIPENERTEIIQTGFRLNQEGKISLKKYYESTDPYSLFQLKGYSIKYESIRRTKLYQQLKP